MSIIKKVNAVLIILSLLCLIAGCGKNAQNQSSTISESDDISVDSISSYIATPTILGCNSFDVTDSVATIDLNNDNISETVCLKIEKTPSLTWAQETKFVLYVNDVAYPTQQSFFSLAHYEGEQYIFDGVPQDMFYIVDVNNADSYVELAISISNKHQNPGTYFYRYQDGSLTNVSYIEGIVGNNSFTYDGTFTCKSPLMPIVDWYANVKYSMDASCNMTAQSGYYDGFVDETLTAEQNRELLKVSIISDVLFVYTEPNDNLRATVLEPCELYLIGTDNQSWVKCATADNTVYWFKCSKHAEGDDLFLNDMGTVPEDVFSGLYRVK